MKIRTALLIAAALFAPGKATAFSNEDFCRDMQELARRVNFDKPAWVDREIRDDGMVVHCLQKTIEHRKFFNIDPVEIGRDWEQRLSARWSADRCRERNLEAIRHGWRIVEITRFPKTTRNPAGRELRAVAACR